MLMHSFFCLHEELFAPCVLLYEYEIIVDFRILINRYVWYTCDDYTGNYQLST